ncbi:hypothetical protein AALH53_02625 [Limosilactobacillus reuteri]
MNAYLGFTRFTIRGLKKAKGQIGITLMALNMKKLAGRPTNFSNNRSKGKKVIRNFCNFRIALLN